MNELDADERDRDANFPLPEHRVKLAERAVPDLHGRHRRIQRIGGDADRDGSSWFGGLVGMKQMNMSYTAEAAMAGGQNSPWNIAIIQDTTASMNDADNGDQCNGTQITCSLLGHASAAG
jgi:hypothetical protein